jgi:hypothetical protein
MTIAELGIMAAAVVITTEVALVGLQVPVRPGTLLDASKTVTPGAKKPDG